MKLEKGLKLSIKSGHNLGLDISAGNIVIKKVATIKDKETKEDAEIYLKPLMIRMEDLFREKDNYLKELFDKILELKNGEWVTFYYVGAVFEPITIPISDFMELI